MKKKQLISLLILLTLTFASYGQVYMKKGKRHKDATKTNQLVGTWKLIDFADIDSITSKWEYPFGKNPRGHFNYTEISQSAN